MHLQVELHCIHTARVWGATITPPSLSQMLRMHTHTCRTTMMAIFIIAHLALSLSLYLSISLSLSLCMLMRFMINYITHHVGVCKINTSSKSTPYYSQTPLPQILMLTKWAVGVDRRAKWTHDFINIRYLQLWTFGGVGAKTTSWSYLPCTLPISRGRTKRHEQCALPDHIPGSENV